MFRSLSDIARGYRNFAHYRLRLLLNHGRIRDDHSPTWIRTRRPRSAAYKPEIDALLAAELALREHARLAVDALADGSADHRRPGRRGRRGVSPPAR